MLAAIQGTSGLVFTAFLTPHLANTVAALWGEAAYNTVQHRLRFFYQNPLIEGIILGSLAAHVVASAVINIKKKLRKGDGKVDQVTTAKKAHSYAGYVLAFFAGSHVFFCRFHGPAPEFSGLSYITRHRLAKFYFLPYLVLFAAAGVVHTGLGLPTALRLSGLPQVARKVRPLVTNKVLLAVGVTLTTLGVAAISGMLFHLPTYSGTPYIVGLGF